MIMFARGVKVATSAPSSPPRRLKDSLRELDQDWFVPDKFRLSAHAFRHASTAVEHAVADAAEPWCAWLSREHDASWGSRDSLNHAYKCGAGKLASRAHTLSRDPDFSSKPEARGFHCSTWVSSFARAAREE
jgi:hypothetical protein